MRTTDLDDRKLRVRRDIRGTNREEYVYEVFDIRIVRW